MNYWYYRSSQQVLTLRLNITRDVHVLKSGYVECVGTLAVRSVLDVKHKIQHVFVNANDYQILAMKGKSVCSFASSLQWGKCITEQESSSPSWPS